MTQEKLADIFQKCIYAVAIGDSKGLRYEGFPRDTKSYEVADGGYFRKHRGTWSDDTSMTLATIDAIASSNSINTLKIQDYFQDWFYDGKYCQTENAFGIGKTVRNAMQELVGQYGIRDNGNGSLMRISPLPFYFFSQTLNNNSIKLDYKNIIETVHKVSSITHGHPISLIACDIYTVLMLQILCGTEKNCLIKSTMNIIRDFEKSYNDVSYTTFLTDFGRLDKLKEIKRDDIQSSGYVISTLEASLWCFLNSSSLEEVIDKAIKLGDDTDTIASISAGIMITYNNIKNKEDLSKILCSDLYNKQMLDYYINLFIKNVILK